MITPKRYLRRSAFVDAIEMPKKESDNFDLQDVIPELAKLAKKDTIFSYVGSGEHHQSRTPDEYDDLGYLRPDADPYLLVRYSPVDSIRINPGDFVVGVDGYLTVMTKSDFEVDFCETQLPVCENDFSNDEDHEEPEYEEEESHEEPEYEENPEEDSHEEENSDVHTRPLEEESLEHDN